MGALDQTRRGFFGTIAGFAAIAAAPAALATAARDERADFIATIEGLMEGGGMVAALAWDDGWRPTELMAILFTCASAPGLLFERRADGREHATYRRDGKLI